MRWAVAIDVDEGVPLAFLDLVAALDDNERQPTRTDATATSTRPLSLESQLLHVFRGYCQNVDDDSLILEPTLLIRPRHDGLTGGLSAYSVSSTRIRSTAALADDALQQQQQPNVRATRFAMACGLLGARFQGCILLAPSVDSATSINVFSDSMLAAITAAATMSPDLRGTILNVILQDIKAATAAANSYFGVKEATMIPGWLGDAAMHHYHDQAAIERLASVMARDILNHSEEEEEEDKGDTDDRDNGGVTKFLDDDGPKELDFVQVPALTILPDRAEQSATITIAAAASSPLCLQCRKPADTLCPACQGAYFCNISCRTIHGWAHDCMCRTWKLYVDRRDVLSTFDGLGNWCGELVGRDSQLANEPYHDFLSRHGIDSCCNTWWRTEFSGWSGGDSDSARVVDITVRKSYVEGFAPIHDIPIDRPIDELVDGHSYRLSELGFLRLESWDEYYRLRGVSKDSIAALLLTFPLTLYYAIVEFGQVPCMVAKMLKRPLRIHIVGAEKEMNCLDIFKEVSYLLPGDVALELVFIVRDDMLPPSLRHVKETRCKLSVVLTDDFTISVFSGSYGDTLNPVFDCGSAPDIVVGFNAGLYAYPSWRSVVSFLYEHKNVMGVFTDYNEMSAVQCASLGGMVSRESVRINPFRQPRAMAVYSMNLPQFSNGFLYTFNQQELE